MSLSVDSPCIHVYMYTYIKVVELEEAVINEGYLKGEQHADHSVTKRDLLVQPFHQLPMRSLSGLSLLFGHQPDPLILILLIWQRYHQCESCFMTTCHRNHTHQKLYFSITSCRWTGL